MEAITIVLNGVAVSGYAGSSILDLARESGVRIPTLCHDPNLSPAGACRLCLVEDERNGALLASCVTPIAPGMVIKTHSPRVVEHRKKILKLLLASHPDSCLVCDKGNRCQLRQLAAEMGIGSIDFQRIPQPDTIEEVNPFIERDLSKCIMCGKCIRADQELVIEGAIDYMNRGTAARPATLGDLPLEKSECTFCGTCLAICPTGALMEKERLFTGTAPTTINTICPYCGCGCAISLGVKDERVVYARPLPDGPVNHGALCVLGSFGIDFIDSPERLRAPLIKVNSEFREATWDEALSRVATEFKRIKEARGADALAVYGSSKCTNEENYLLQRFTRTVLGTNNIDNGSCFYNAASCIGLGTSLGYASTSGTIASLEKSQAIMVIGADPEISAPAVAYAVKRAAMLKGAELIVIDPRRTALAQFASIWLRPHVASDIALLNGLAKVVIDEQKLDVEFVTRMTDNFTQWSRSLEKYTPAYVEELTGVNKKDLQKTARAFSGAEQVSIVYGNGVTQQANGASAVTAIANLIMLTGQAGKLGGVFALQRESNALGACDTGVLPALLPGYKNIDDAQERKRFEERWRCSLPVNSGLTALEMIAAAQAGKVRGMFIAGENPAATFPHPSLVTKALENLECLAVADMFLTETARLATVVLPAASFAEKEGTFTNFEGRVQRLRRAIAPAGQSLPDGEIILKLAAVMGSPLPYPSPQEVFNEIEEMVPFFHPAALSDVGAKDTELGEADGRVPAGRRLHKGLFPSGFERFTPVEYPPPDLSKADGYSLTLIVGSSRYHFGSGSRSSRSSRLKRFAPEVYLEINPAEAKEIGLASGDKVKVISAQGDLVTGVSITEAVPPGLLFMPLTFPTTPIYELFAGPVGSGAQVPALKSCAVRLERVTGNA